MTETTPAPLDDDPRLDAPALGRRGPDKGKRARPDEAHADPSLRSLIPWGSSVVCWTPLWHADTHRSTVGQVAVFRLGDRKTAAQVEAFACHGAGAELGAYDLPSKQAQTEALRLFNRIVLEGLRPRAVHAAMLALRPYVLALDETIPGARHGQGRHRTSLADDFTP